MLRLKDPVRVQEKDTKVKHTISRAAYDPEVHKLLENEDANNIDGSPRAPEFPKSPVEQKGGDKAASTDGPKADTEKEK